MKVKSLKGLRKVVEKAIDDSLENEVFETARSEEIKSIETDVFEEFYQHYRLILGEMQ